MKQKIRLSIPYIASLVFLAITLSLQFYFFNKNIGGQADDSRVINLAGRQRMLSQRITQLSLRLNDITLGSDEKDSLISELDTALNSFRVEHLALLSGDVALGVIGRNSDKIKELFSDIDQEFVAIAVNADNILQGVALNQNIGEFVFRIVDNQSIFLNGMDAIVFQYDREAKAKVDNIYTIVWGAAPLMLLILLIEALFIFRPSVNKIHDLLGELEKFRLVVINAFGSIIFTDVDGKILYANPATEKISGYSMKEILGNKPSLWGRQMSLEFYKKLWQIIKFDKKPYFGQLINKRKNGESYDAELRAAPILDERGEVMFLVGNERDITKEKELERARADFISLASHQLRTPLTGTKWLIDTMQGNAIGKLNKKQKEYLDNIHTINERMLNLVSDMLNILKVESSEASVFNKEIQSSEICQHIATMLGPAAKERGVILSIDRGDCGSISFKSNLEMLKIIMECFVSNAINYSSPGKEIVLGFKAEGDNMVFFVKDGGIGIPKDEQEGLFKRFYRASNAKEFRSSGTGLGLYLARALADKIGAKITFESEVGKGSVFYLHIPLRGL